MFDHILFAGGLFVALFIGLLYFRDLGDISQMILKVRRQDLMRVIRNEHRLLLVGLVSTLLMIFAYSILDGGVGWVFWIAFPIILFLYIFPVLWVHVALRNRKDSARYYSIREASEYIAPGAAVFVIENNGVARAHPTAHLLRPHLAGNAEGLGGENVIMTYCAMANLGIAYTPEIDGAALDLAVLGQHGNNLILRDNTTREPIQQIYGYRDCAGKNSPGMKPWPTFGMTFRSFARAYPEGEVFLNKPPSNPLLALFDMAIETVFAAGIAHQHDQAKPIMENMTRHDDRLPTKTYVWGIDIGDDAVCFTQDFIVEQGNLVNTEIGGQRVVLAWDPVYESLGAWHNESGAPIQEIDFFGHSDQGQLQRVATLKPGLFWHVWSEFYPDTDINRKT